MLQDMVTGRRVSVPPAVASQTTCSPAWCAQTSFTPDGSTRVEVVHPDGSGRVRLTSSGTTVPALPQVALLDRFEVLWQTDPTLDLTHNGQLLVFDLTTRRTVELSPDAATVGCAGSILWWSSGDATRAAVSWHSLDLRTI